MNHEKGFWTARQMSAFASIYACAMFVVTCLRLEMCGEIGYFLNLNCICHPAWKDMTQGQFNARVTHKYIWIAVEIIHSNRLF